MTVAELISMLQEFQPTDKVIATWEGTMNGVCVYGGAPGVVILDADGGFYREGLEGKLTAEDDSVADVGKRNA